MASVPFLGDDSHARSTSPEISLPTNDDYASL
jgi:hypothetical protein